MKLSRSQIRSALLTLALGAAFAFYGAMKLTDLHDTAALYIGLPLVLALVVSLIETEKLTATTMKVLTIAILLSPIVIGEGFICMMMAAPIMYGVAFLAAQALQALTRAALRRDEMRRRDETGENRDGGGDGMPPVYASGILVLLALLSLEGTTPLLSAARLNTVTAEKTVAMSVDEVRAALARTPRFDKRPDSFFTRLFPGPVRVEGEGLSIGDTRRIHLVYNKWVVTNPLAGDAVFEVAENHGNAVTFRLVEDTSYINLYLVWGDATAEFMPAGEGRTRVKVTLRYSRKLDPAWYFAPMERSAVRDAAETIIDSLSAPGA